MAIYYVDHVNGDDANSGNSALNAWQSHPSWFSAKDNAAAAMAGLLDGDEIHHVSDGSEIALGVSTRGFRAIPKNGIITRTAPGNPSPVRYNFLSTHESTADWVETSSGSNLWDFQNLESVTTEVRRLFIGNVGQREAPDLASVSESTPYFGDAADTFRVYCVGNPFTVYGPGTDNFAFQQSNDRHLGSILLLDDVATDETQFYDLDLVGSREAVRVDGGHARAYFEQIRGYKYFGHGMRSRGTLAMPNLYPQFQSCLVSLDTNLNEFPYTYGEPGSDGFALVGPNLGAVIDDCDVFDNGHTAYVISPLTRDGQPDQLGVGSHFGAWFNEIRNSRADNRNSIYGRAVGVTGSRTDYPSCYNVVHHITATHMNTRNQISGYRNELHTCNFSNTAGSTVTGGAVFGDGTQRIRGEGINLFAAAANGLGENEAIECKVYNNTVVGNSHAGIHVVNNGVAALMGGNEISRNVCVDNNLVADPENPTGQFWQIAEEGPTVTPNVYSDNRCGLTAGDANSAVIYFNGQMRTIAEWNALAVEISGNSADIVNVSRDGKPAPGATTNTTGTLAPIEPAALIPEADMFDLRNPDWLTAGTGITKDRDGYQASDEGSWVFYRPVHQGDAQDITASVFIYQRDDTTTLPELDDNVRLDIYDGVVVADITQFDVDPGEVYENILNHTTSSGSTINNFRTRAQNTDGVLLDIGVAFARMVNAATINPNPLSDRYDQTDIDGNSAAQYVGAYATLQNPVLPNVVQSIEGNAYMQAEAEALIEAHLHAVGTVTQVADPAPAGTVLSQSVAAGSQNPVGTVVDLQVSAAFVAIPDTRGLLESAAITALTNDGFTVGTITYEHCGASQAQAQRMDDPGLSFDEIDSMDEVQ